MRSTAAFSPTPGVWDCLTSITFVAKLEVVSELLRVCEAAALAFNCERVGSLLLPTGPLLVRPVKKFVAEYVQSMLGKRLPDNKAP